MKLNNLPGWEVVPGPPDENGLTHSFIYYEGVAVAGSKRPMTVEDYLTNSISWIEKNRATYEQHRTLIPIIKYTHPVDGI